MVLQPAAVKTKAINKLPLRPSVLTPDDRYEPQQQ